MNRFILTATIVLLCFSTVSAAFYADVDIYAEDTVTIQGESNHPRLTPGEYNVTETVGGVTTLDIEINESFSDYLYTVHLPDGAQLINVESAASTRILSGDSLRIRGVAEDKPFQVTASYTVDESSNPPYLLIGFLIAVIGVGVSLWVLRDDWEPPRDVSERQRAILVFLHDNGGEATQATIADELAYPKSSTSRNLDSLERKGYVERVNEGNSNTVVLTHP